MFSKATVLSEEYGIIKKKLREIPIAVIDAISDCEEIEEERKRSLLYDRIRNIYSSRRLSNEDKFVYLRQLIQDRSLDIDPTIFSDIEQDITIFIRNTLKYRPQFRTKNVNDYMSKEDSNYDEVSFRIFNKMMESYIVSMTEIIGNQGHEVADKINAITNNTRLNIETRIKNLDAYCKSIVLSDKVESINNLTTKIQTLLREYSNFMTITFRFRNQNLVLSFPRIKRNSSSPRFDKNAKAGAEEDFTAENTSHAKGPVLEETSDHNAGSGTEKDFIEENTSNAKGPVLEKTSDREELLDLAKELLRIAANPLFYSVRDPIADYFNTKVLKAYPDSDMVKVIASFSEIIVSNAELVLGKNIPHLEKINVELQELKERKRRENIEIKAIKGNLGELYKKFYTDKEDPLELDFSDIKAEEPELDSRKNLEKSDTSTSHYKPMSAIEQFNKDVRNKLLDVVLAISASTLPSAQKLLLVGVTRSNLEDNTADIKASRLQKRMSSYYDTNISGLKHDAIENIVKALHDFNKLFDNKTGEIQNHIQNGYISQTSNLVSDIDNILETIAAEKEEDAENFEKKEKYDLTRLQSNIDSLFSLYRDEKEIKEILSIDDILKSLNQICDRCLRQVHEDRLPTHLKHDKAAKEEAKNNSRRIVEIKDYFKEIKDGLSPLQLNNIKELVFSSLKKYGIKIEDSHTNPRTSSSTTEEVRKGPSSATATAGPTETDAKKTTDFSEDEFLEEFNKIVVRIIKKIRSNSNIPLKIQNSCMKHILESLNYNRYKDVLFVIGDNLPRIFQDHEGFKDDLTSLKELLYARRHYKYNPKSQRFDYKDYYKNFLEKKADASKFQTIKHAVDNAPVKEVRKGPSSAAAAGPTETDANKTTAFSEDEFLEEFNKIVVRIINKIQSNGNFSPSSINSYLRTISGTFTFRRYSDVLVLMNQSFSQTLKDHKDFEDDLKSLHNLLFERHCEYNRNSRRYDDKDYYREFLGKEVDASKFQIIRNAVDSALNSLTTAAAGPTEIDAEKTTAFSEDEFLEEFNKIVVRIINKIQSNRNFSSESRIFYLNNISDALTLTQYSNVLFIMNDRFLRTDGYEEFKDDLNSLQNLLFERHREYRYDDKDYYREFLGKEVDASKFQTIQDAVNNALAYIKEEEIEVEEIEVGFDDIYPEETQEQEEFTELHIPRENLKKYKNSKLATGSSDSGVNPGKSDSVRKTNQRTFSSFPYKKLEELENRFAIILKHESTKVSSRSLTKLLNNSKRPYGYEHIIGIISTNLNSELHRLEQEFSKFTKNLKEYQFDEYQQSFGLFVLTYVQPLYNKQTPTFASPNQLLEKLTGKTRDHFKIARKASEEDNKERFERDYKTSAEENNKARVERAHKESTHEKTTNLIKELSGELIDLQNKFLKMITQRGFKTEDFATETKMTLSNRPHSYKNCYELLYNKLNTVEGTDNIGRNMLSKFSALYYRFNSNRLETSWKERFKDFLDAVDKQYGIDFSSPKSFAGNSEDTRAFSSPKSFAGNSEYTQKDEGHSATVREEESGFYFMLDNLKIRLRNLIENKDIKLSIHLRDREKEAFGYVDLVGFIDIKDVTDQKRSKEIEAEIKTLKEKFAKLDKELGSKEAYKEDVDEFFKQDFVPKYNESHKLGRNDKIFILILKLEHYQNQLKNILQEESFDINQHINGIKNKIFQYTSSGDKQQPLPYYDFIIDHVKQHINDEDAPASKKLLDLRNDFEKLGKISDTDPNPKECQEIWTDSYNNFMKKLLPKSRPIRPVEYTQAAAKSAGDRGGF